MDLDAMIKALTRRKEQQNSKEVPVTPEQIAEFINSADDNTVAKVTSLLKPREENNAKEEVQKEEVQKEPQVKLVMASSPPANTEIGKVDFDDPDWVNNLSDTEYDKLWESGRIQKELETISASEA